MRNASSIQDRSSLVTAGLAGRPVTGRLVAAAIGTIILSLVLATGLVAALEAAGLEDASPVYLLAVVVVASAFGTVPAVATGILAFLTYDILFTEPRFSLIVADPREWLDLLLFLVVAVVIGRLVADQRRRAEEAARRAAEANSLFALSRTLAVAGSTEEAAAEVVDRLRVETGMAVIVVRVGAPGVERPIAASPSGGTTASSSIVTTLVRTPGDEPARWVRTHVGGGTALRRDQYQVRIELDDERLGTLVAERDRAAGPPGREATRILALAADQLATSLRRDQLRRAATDLEVARQGDTLKTALVDAVSHDLRTPLASIRATAGGLADPAVAWTDTDRRSAAAVIDAEAARLDRLVGGLLDLGRIASGSIDPTLEPHEPWALVEPVIERLRPAFGDRPIDVALPGDLPPVLVDAALMDVVVSNLLDNAIRHAPAPAALRITGRADPVAMTLTVEDGGPGVPAADLPHLFDRFWRADAAPGRTAPRPGMGIGLSVVRGLVEAMGGTVMAETSALGGLAIHVRLVIDVDPIPGGAP